MRRGKRVTPKPPRRALVTRGSTLALNSVPGAPEGTVLQHLFALTLSLMPKLGVGGGGGVLPDLALVAWGLPFSNFC